MTAEVQSRTIEYADALEAVASFLRRHAGEFDAAGVGDFRTALIGNVDVENGVAVCTIYTYGNDDHVERTWLNLDTLFGGGFAHSEGETGMMHVRYAEKTYTAIRWDDVEIDLPMPVMLRLQRSTTKEGA